MGLNRQRTREMFRRAQARASGPTAGGVMGPRPRRAQENGYYNRGRLYGDGLRYGPPGIARYGSSRYGDGATYGERPRAVKTARYGWGFYGRGYRYG